MRDRWWLNGAEAAVVGSLTTSLLGPFHIRTSDGTFLHWVLPVERCQLNSDVSSSIWNPKLRSCFRPNRPNSLTSPYISLFLNFPPPCFFCCAACFTLPVSLLKCHNQNARQFLPGRSTQHEQWPLLWTLKYLNVAESNGRQLVLL